MILSIYYLNEITSESDHIMKKIKSVSSIFIMFHVFKTVLLSFKSIPSFYKENDLNFPRLNSKINLEGKLNKQYFLLLYILGRQSNQKSIGLRTYRVMRIALKLFVYNSKFDSKEDRMEEYRHMLSSTKLW